MNPTQLAEEHQLGQPVIKLEGRRLGSMPMNLLMLAIVGSVVLGFVAVLSFFLGPFDAAWQFSMRVLQIAAIALLVGFLSFYILECFSQSMSLALFDRGLIYQAGSKYHVIPYAEVSWAKQEIELYNLYKSRIIPSIILDLLGRYFCYYRLQTVTQKKFCFTSVAFGNKLIRVGWVILRTIHQHHYQALKREFDAGQVLQFGPIALSQQALRCNNRSLDWSVLESINFEQGTYNYWLDIYQTNADGSIRRWRRLHWNKLLNNYSLIFFLVYGLYHHHLSQADAQVETREQAIGNFERNLHVYIQHDESGMVMDAIYFLVTDLIRGGDSEGAIALLNWFIKQLADAFFLYEQRGEEYLKLGNRGQAIDDLYRARNLAQQQSQTTDYQRLSQRIQELEQPSQSKSPSSTGSSTANQDMSRPVEQFMTLPVMDNPAYSEINELAFPPIGTNLRMSLPEGLSPYYKRYQAGNRIQLGTVEVDQQGLTIDGEILPWQHIYWMDMRRDTLTIWRIVPEGEGIPWKTVHRPAQRNPQRPESDSLTDLGILLGTIFYARGIENGGASSPPTQILVDRHRQAIANLTQAIEFCFVFWPFLYELRATLRLELGDASGAIADFEMAADYCKHNPSERNDHQLLQAWLKQLYRQVANRPGTPTKATTLPTIPLPPDPKWEDWINLNAQEVVQLITQPTEISRDYDAYAAGDDLLFLPITVSQEGLRISRETLPWNEIQSFRWEGQTLVIYRQSKLGGLWRTISVDQLANAERFLTLLIAIFYDRGLTCSQQSDHTGAIAAFDRVIELYPNWALLFVARGTSRVQLQDLQGGLADFQQAATLWQAQNNIEAVQNVQSLLQHFQSDPIPEPTPSTSSGKAHFLYTNTQMPRQEGNLAGAIAQFYNARAEAYKQAGNLAGAIEDYTQAIERTANLDDVADEMLNQLRDVGFTPQQLRAATDPAAINPTRAQFYIDRGVAYWTMGHYDQAIADYNQAIELCPTIARSYYNRANVHYDLNDIQAALWDYSRAIELNPNYAIAYGNRGNCYMAFEDYLQAIQNYDQAIRLNPTAIDYYNRGEAYNRLCSQSHQLIHLHQAIADYTQSIQLDPSFTVTYVKRGSLQLAIGEVAAGRADLQMAIAQAQQKGDTNTVALAMQLLQMQPPSPEASPEQMVALKLPNSVETLKQQLLQLLYGDQAACQRLVEAERQKYPHKSNADLYRDVIDRLERDRQR